MSHVRASRVRTSRNLAVAVAAAVLATLATAPTASAAPAAPAPVSCSGCWHPALQTSWNWVISKVPTAPYRKVAMYDIDGFNASAADVKALHNAGIKAVCYLSAGTYEDWRSDASQFPSALLGKSNGWPGEKWLDIRDIQKSGSVLHSIMDARLDMCHQKGFDMVELDNVDGYTNSTGFSLKAADQTYFNATLANDSHARGMSVLQKNDNEQIPTLLKYFDGALNEQCNEYQECTTAQNGDYGYDQYVAAGKPVFQAEYNLATSKFCSKDNAADFNGVKFSIDLDDSTFQPCR
ncbi:endo alpha-1,4 polygalactosaminidase [Streptacidiphilus sp. N1-12]|uniref:Endo alpha-1,4 polygalactosaminidase n=2 Tax=Streptacidiphilus alkalitolerans TaxID=3342712 RepID=A0ABV6VHM0_9ACTN